MKQSGLYVLPLMLFAVSCKNNPILPDFVEPSLGEITYKQIDYNLFSVRYASGSQLISKDVIAVAVGEVDTSGFHVRDSISAVYDPGNGTYSTGFSTTMSSNISRVSLTIRTRYYHSSGSWSDFDSTLSTMKYPYLSTEVVLVTSGGYFAEDIDVSDSILYGQINDDVLMYDMRTQTTSQVRVFSYECITVVDNRYIFYDHYNWSLYRYDLMTNSMVQFVYHPSGRFLLGLESYNGALYELLYDNGSPNKISLLRYSLSGELQDSIPMNRTVQRLTILDGIAYFQGFGGLSPIYRFDLSTKTFIDQFKPPSANFEGIRIRNGYFYFSDYTKRAIARFPLNELFSYGKMDPTSEHALANRSLKPTANREEVFFQNRR